MPQSRQPRATRQRKPELSSLNSMRAKLTPKQRAMADMLAGEGVSKIDAYREVANSVTENKRVQWNNASLLSSEVQVVANGVRLANAAMLSRSPSEMRELALGGIVELATLDSESPVRLKALELVGKLPSVDLWEERGKATERDPDSVLSDLEARLSSLLDGPDACDAVVDVERADQLPDEPNV